MAKYTQGEPAPLWSYPARSHDARTFDVYAEPQDTQQGASAPVLRVVQGYLTYAVVFAAGWFFCAAFQLARLKGWL